MKKTLLILAALITLSMVGGSLYNTLANLSRVGDEVKKYASVDQYPHKTSYGLMAPMPSFSLY